MDAGAVHPIYSDKLGFFRHIITHTVNRYLACGDPREGIARYECRDCRTSLAVPFSCKTRLFFDRYVTPVNELVYGNIEDDTAANDQFSQLQRNDDAFFNQEITLCPESVEGW